MSTLNLKQVPLATLAGLLPHYLAFYLFGSPLWTETIAEWIMARTPSAYAVTILQTLGPWAKPFAMTGALALLGFAAMLSMEWKWIGPLMCAGILGFAFGYSSWLGQLSFWTGVLFLSLKPVPHSLARRELMVAGVAAVALESYFRNAALARRAVEPVALSPFHPPADTFAPGLVRKSVTPIAEFYGMSKNTVDPVIDPRSWKLKITADGRTLRQLSYPELLALPRMERYATLRCISNTLKSDLMGTAQWSGVPLSRLIDRAKLPSNIVEAAILGTDGHADSFPLDYAFSDELLLALGMNGKTLDRTHGFPIRLIAPRYYGFKSVKWISEIAFVSRPFFGTWPKLGYTKEPVVHTASHFDRVLPGPAGLQAGGVSFAGIRGIERVEVRADAGPWVTATLDQPLSPYTWTRWWAKLPVNSAAQVEARALDRTGRWQESTPGPLFPSGVTGPTVRSIGS